MVELDSKKIKVLNDLNQMTKKLFTEYYIFPNGIIVSDHDGYPTDKDGNPKLFGFHFCHIEGVEKIQEVLQTDVVIKISSDTLFKTVRDHKKNIRGVLNDEHTLSFIIDGVGQIDFGQYMGAVKSTVLTRYQLATQYHQMEKDEGQLSSDVIRTLIGNEVITYGDDDYRIRVTKELIPFIKDTLPTYVSFQDSEEENIFDAMIRLEKDKFTGYHVYRCLKF